MCGRGSSPQKETGIAWLVQWYESVDNEDNPVAKYVDREGHPARRLDALWVTNIDGTGRKEIGRLKVGDEHAPSFLRWLPSGQAVSFARYDGIYVVPVK